ncbi:Nn.00g007740.m01.CDS01 [Neocucurbitaria sp. VM-36]
MASLLSIPLELLVSISSFLPTSDLAALRLTCKQVEKSLYEWFSKEFFTKKQFMLTHSSLQTLIDISKHVSFSKKLSHIIIATNTYDEIPLRFRDSDAATRYIQGYEDQKALLSTGIDREMLTEAFQNLVNLDTVGIRDFNAPSRVRDGDHASWSSWGATTVYRETGIQLQFSEQGTYHSAIGSRFVARVFLTVMYALGKADRTPSQFEVLLRQHGLPDSAFYLPEFLRPTTESMLQGVKTLLLNVDLALRYLHTQGSGISADPHAGRSLRRFLAFTPNLTHLRLNFQKHLVANNEAFLGWLGDPTPSAGSQAASFLEPAPIALPFLKQLDLGQLTVRSDILLAIIKKFAPTLEEINFWRMGIHSRAPPPFGHKPNLWADLFERLARIPQLELKYLKVGMLQQDHMHVNFKTEDDETARPLKVKEYAGRQMERFLTELQEQVFVTWPEPIVMDEENTEESDEDEDMVDDDDEEEDEDEDGDEDDEE